MSLKMRNKEKKRPDGDDGRVIASMNVEGMPWYGETPRPESPRQPEEPKLPAGPSEPPLTKKESFRIAFNAMLGGLLIGLVFVVCALLFILFCIYVWFR